MKKINLGQKEVIHFIGVIRHEWFSPNYEKYGL